MTSFQQPYRETCNDFLTAVKHVDVVNRTELVERCKAALSSRYRFQSTAITQHFDDLARSSAHLSWTELYRAAFKAWLAVALPVQWLDEYAAKTAGPVNVVSIVVRQYEFLFDLPQERVVAVCGLSWKDKSPRDTQYMAEFLGAVTSERRVRALVSGLTAQHATRRLESIAKSWKDRFFEELGTDYDRGHFISLRQGGVYDINLFPQRADVNRGRGEWRVYRNMETECVNRPGTFCFSRPIYSDLTWVPSELEYGVVHAPEHTTLRRFPNRP